MQRIDLVVVGRIGSASADPGVEASCRADGQGALASGGNVEQSRLRRIDIADQVVAAALRRNKAGRLTVAVNQGVRITLVEVEHQG